MKRKAQTWHLKGALGIAVVFAAGLFVAGAFGGVDPLGSTSSGATDTGTSSQTASTVPYIVTFASGTSSDQQTSEIAAAGATDTGAIAPLSMHAIDVPSDSEQTVVSALQSDADVADVERDHSRDTADGPNDPGYADQWNLPMVGWNQIFGSLNPLGSSTIAVLDTGVSSTTGDLNVSSGWSAFGTDPTDDANGHGTAVASIAAATANNGIGIAGINLSNVMILPVQVLDSAGQGQDSDIIQGVVWAADHGANVILMSFSNPGFSQALQDAVSYAWSKGAVVVAATGNDGSNSPTYPAGDAGVMGIAGSDQTDQPWANSNTGADTFLAAPATNIPADATDGSATSITGTSASAAMVAGAAALLHANDPLATNAIVDGRLARTANPVGTPDQTGNGRLDLARAVADASTDPVTPLGAPGGGPFVGPYVAAALADGDGSMAVSPTTATAASTGNTFTFTFTAGANGGNMNGGAVAMTIPAGWTAPQTSSSSNPGFVSLATGTCGTTGRTVSGSGPWVVTFTIGTGGSGCSTTQQFTFTYAGGGTKVTAPSTAGIYTFATQTKASAGGTLTSIATQPTVTVTSGTTATTTTVTSSSPSNTSTYGDSVTFTATISPSPSGAGTVDFKDGATTVCSGATVAGATATCTTSTLNAGSHSITGAYSGATGFGASTSSALAQTVNKKQLLVNADNQSKTYDGTSTEPTPTWTY
ncbi:MAG TPA: S8 family serine peptidase, partial [Mycobacteriales bacterium]|nr:S8 family serine peptidase [Mycobacteriales bacterium]